MKKTKILEDTKKIIIKATYDFFSPVIWLGRKMRDVWNLFTYHTG